MEYFTASSSTFTPSCSIFTPPDASHAEAKRRRRNNIIELGSGQSVASLHLASQLHQEDRLVLTDLPNVVPLMQQSVGTWAEQRRRQQEQEHGAARDEEPKGTMPVVEPMAWGEDISHLDKYGGFTHIVCCDLVSSCLFVTCRRRRLSTLPLYSMCRS